jgi:hypothetical protein
MDVIEIKNNIYSKMEDLENETILQQLNDILTEVNLKYSVHKLSESELSILHVRAKWISN